MHSLSDSDFKNDTNIPRPLQNSNADYDPRTAIYGKTGAIYVRNVRSAKF